MTWIANQNEEGAEPAAEGEEMPKNNAHIRRKMFLFRHIKYDDKPPGIKSHVWFFVLWKTVVQVVWKTDDTYFSFTAIRRVDDKIWKERRNV